MQIEICELTESLIKPVEDLFVAYSRELELDEHKDPRLTEAVLREKIFRGLFLEKWRQGIVNITISLADDDPIAFAIWQVDGPLSDWNKRPGWGFIREFYVDSHLRGQGVGAALLEEVLRRIFKKANHVYLTADESATGFWQACGFAETGEWEGNGNRIMERHKE